MKIFKRIILLLPQTVFAISACESMGVEPWERDVLAKDETLAILQGNEAEAFLDDQEVRYWCLR